MKIAGGAVLGPLRQVFGGESVSGLGEGELLDRFLAGRDEPSFTALVARLGPMVLGVCRRTLTDPRDVEDAFQATFLVLVRRGGTLRDRDRLAPWLFGVARRVAARARSESARRRARERPWAGEPIEDPGRDDHRAELARALVEEIDRLPESLRGAVVLCCGEGLSYEEAAARLRSTVPAIRGRLARARERLRTRLVRRGFAPTAGVLAAWTGAEAGFAASVPFHLIEMTTRAALACAAGNFAAAGAIPLAVATLAEGATRTMILTKWKFLAAGVATLGVASGVGVLAQQPPPADPGPKPAASASRPTGVSRVVMDETTTVGPDGRPVTTTRPVTVTETQTEPGLPLPPARAPSTDQTPRLPEPGRSPFQMDGPAPPANRPKAEEAKRLDSLEEKLDRLLKTLEPSERPTFISSPDEATDLDVVDAPRPTQPPTRRLTPGTPLQVPPPARRPVRAPSPPPEVATPQPDPGVNRSNARAANAGTMTSRLEAVEQKLGRLEARFAEMERKLGIQTGEGANSPPLAEEQPAQLEPIPNPGYNPILPAPGDRLVPHLSPEPRDTGPIEVYRKPR